jgi:thimet oligopeptidase
VGAAWSQVELPSAVPYVFPAYTLAAQVNSACSGMLSRARAAQRRLPVVNSAALLPALDAMVRDAEDVVGPLSLLAAVHPSKALREAAETCERDHQAFTTALLQDREIYQRLKAVLPVDAIDRRFQRDQLDAFEDAGVALSPAHQQRARALNRDITRLTQSFERRLREDKTRVPFDAAELVGVPAAVLQGKAHDAQGRILLGLDAPTVQPVLMHATLEATRERMWRVYISQGGDANLRTLAQLVARRTALAQLMGSPTYADFALRRRMAGKAQAVQQLLGNVQQAVAERERHDLAALRADKAQDTGQPGAVIQRWDVAHYSERVRRARHEINPEQFRAYFPPEASLQFAFALAQRLFGVRFEAQPQTLWHAEARAYAVYDTAQPAPQYLGTLLVDLYPRDDKYNHAAVWSFRNASTLTGRKPAAALVVNFNRQGLSLDELETLLHEFGHALHSLLSSTRYAAQGGTNTQLDFVEAPSQMLEAWAYDPQVLALFQQVCSSCAPVPAALLARAERARHFGKGIQVARQHLFASYDLALYGPGQPQPLALWQRMEGATPLGHVPGSRFPAGFAHIAGGYAAGYYGYLWSLVLAEDLRTAFAADRLSSAVGQRYRTDLLSQGGQVAPQDMLRRFLGREPNSDAFFKSLQQQ